MRQIHTDIEIQASPETVWSVLTDFDAYPEWNDRTRIEGEAVVGERLRVSPGPAAGSMPTFRPRVRRADPNRELAWRGHLYVRGLFDGDHRFRIEPTADGCRLIQAESFSGLLVGPILRRYGADTEANFRAVNEALQARAESVAAARQTGTEETETVGGEEGTAGPVGDEAAA